MHDDESTSDVDDAQTTRRTTVRTVLLATVLVVAAAAVATPATAASVSGTVTVANGTADGDQVTVTPMSQNMQKAGASVTTTVRGDSFRAGNVTDAAAYFVRVQHDGVSHYALVRNETANIRLGATVSGRVVDENGTPVEGTRVRLTSPYGPPVASVETGANGSFSFGPMKRNTTYTVRVNDAGVPYQQQVHTGANATGVVMETPPPTSNASVLTPAGGNPASHVVQVLAPQNGSETVAAFETVSLKNTGDRPFVGTVSLSLPEGATPTSAMYQDRQVPFERSTGTVTVNATVAAGDTARVGVAYDLSGRTLSKSMVRDTDRLAVVFRGYQTSSVNHSQNLRTGQSPIPLLTNRQALSSGEQVRVTLPKSTAASGTSGSTGGATSPGGSAPSDQSPRFPALPLAVAMGVTVGGGILAYRVF